MGIHYLILKTNKETFYMNRVSTPLFHHIKYNQNVFEILITGAQILFLRIKNIAIWWIQREKNDFKNAVKRQRILTK